MLVQPWDASLDDPEWQAWIAEGHDFGQLTVNGLPGQPPVVVPTHFTCDGHQLLVHLARPNPVWKAIEHDPNVVFTVIGDYAYPRPLARQARHSALRRRAHQLLHGRPVHLPRRHRRRPGGKYDDHKPVEHRTAVADHLTGRGQGLDAPTARQQRRRLDRIGPWKH
jgi:transcriptional regulator